MVRALRDREQRNSQGNIARVFAAPDLDQLLHDLELVRVPLEKFELQRDRKLEAPLQMFTLPYADGIIDVSTYDRSDPNRALILPTGFSTVRGSYGWFTSDWQHGGPKWLYRRDLAETFLKLALAEPSAELK
ncbi:hypothetical protein [Bradyrhizobium liaoningense]|uniref:hypothetical protein n=1 Tax=Bradyrhizobium liaoningense TaxID=43992 RepID=UPI001BA5C613|nr:hypothetical protein [Bradyrhizobium liaoningense]MBR0714792.1 hypothetical protein [Bradyrhizobium liaoningense]